MTAMNRKVFIVVACLLASAALFAGGCESRAAPDGYWEGRGTAKETPMKDAYKELNRSADFEFWFALDKQGNAVGEVEITYDAVLRVENLPKATLPAPGITVSIDPEVGGKMTDLNPRRRFPLVGVLDGEHLSLAIGIPEKQRKPLEFTLRADPGLSTAGGAAGASINVPLGGAGTIVKKIDMKPFDPFGGKAKVEKRPGGPFAAHYEDQGKDYAINWNARQVTGEQRRIEMTPELELELRRLREALK